MPSFLDARDLRLLIGAGVVMLLLLGLTYAVSPPPAQQSLGYPSSYSGDWAGAKAAFLLLQNLGYSVERWEQSPEDLPIDSKGMVLVLAEPFQGATVVERSAVRRFVSGGGRVVAMGASAAKIVPDAGATEVPDWNLQPKTYSALVPSPQTHGAPEITMIAPDRWDSSSHTWLNLYGAGDNIVALSYKVGQGEVIWWASPSPISNGSIRDKGNMAFFLNSIGAPENSRVLWDEYFHGARGSLGSYILGTPLPWAALQIGVAFLAILLTFSRRSGAKRAPAADSRLSPLEFVETLGDLYQSARAAPAAVGVSYRRFRFALSRKLAMAPAAKLSDISRAAAVRFGWQEDSLLDTLTRSERAMRSINLSDREALDLVRQLHDYSASLEPAGGPEQETPAWR
ncbi:MAG TPA: DUF4350 domain-containing protein [Verrucomicrobiae bacterium]|nr:DUF4350 domain-containing protein [Verrucomicrobiae bacterium]